MCWGRSGGGGVEGEKSRHHEWWQLAYDCVSPPLLMTIITDSLTWQWKMRHKKEFVNPSAIHLQCSVCLLPSFIALSTASSIAIALQEEKKPHKRSHLQELLWSLGVAFVQQLAELHYLEQHVVFITEHTFPVLSSPSSSSASSAAAEVNPAPPVTRLSARDRGTNWPLLSWGYILQEILIYLVDGTNHHPLPR